MRSEPTERQLRRAAAQQLFDTLALDHLGAAGVSRANMFGSEGLRVNAKFFAFVGGDGELIIKLPAAQAASLVADGEAEQVRTGRSPMREWVGIPMPADQDRAERWRDLLADAYRYVASLTPPTTGR